MQFLKSLDKKKLLFAGLVLLFVLSLSTAAVSTFGKADSRFSGVRIYLSPSNQYTNYYAVGDTTEMEQCDLIAQKTAEKLKKLGFTVMVGQSGATLKSRCDESNAFHADMHIPIHTNALNGEYTGGTHVYVYGSDEQTAAESFLSTLGKISRVMTTGLNIIPNCTRFPLRMHLRFTLNASFTTPRRVQAG